MCNGGGGCAMGGVCSRIDGCAMGPHPVVRNGATRNDSSEHSEHCTIHTISCQCYLYR